MRSSIVGSKRHNVLVLDGGGVRGLSSLLILQALMLQINLQLETLGATCGELQPRHVFQLVAGTSTGGLIALMLGKMGMTIKECIAKYEGLSQIIFGKKHLRGRITHGLAPARYSGKCMRRCIRDLLSERQLDEDLLMNNEGDEIACAVVCREHTSSSQYSKLKNTAVPICNLPCNDQLICKVCDAARATSAAPTFFPVTKIGDRYFADGGLAHNNPSFAIYFHYTANERKRSTKPMASSGTSAPQFSRHGNLDCSCVRFTNIGTGAKVDEVEPGKRERLANLIPGFIRKGVFLKQTLTEIATNSEEKAEFMRHFQYLNSNIIMYERFDANHGVSSIRLDDFKALKDIRTKTGLYLEEEGTKDLLKDVGSAIAADYLKFREIEEQATQPTQSTLVESRNQPSAQSVDSITPSSVNGPSNRSGDPRKNGHMLPPNHDGATNGVPMSPVQSAKSSLIPPHQKGQSEDYTDGISDADLIEPARELRAKGL